MSQLPFLFRQLSRHKYSYLIGIIAIFTTNLMAVSIPHYLQKAVDLLTLGIDAIGHKQAELSETLLIILSLALAVVLVRTLSRVFFFNPGRKVEYQVKNEIFNKLTHLEKDYYDKNSIGSIISRLQNDITGLRLLAGFGAMQFFNIITALSLTPYKMWESSPRLTVYCVLPIVLAFGLVRFGIHFLVKHTKTRQAKLQNISGYIVSSLSGVDVLKGYSLEDWSHKTFEQKNRALLNETLSISLIRSFMMPILNNLEQVLKVVVLSVGGIYVINGTFTIGQLTEFIAYTALLTQPIMGLGWLSTLYQQGLVGLDSISSILNEKTPRKDRPRLNLAEKKSLFADGITLTDLSYSYNNQDDPVLSEISFHIKPNQTVGVLGKIGSGKTTLVDCINGYLKVSDGTISFNNKDINSLNPKDLRQQIRTVSQDVFLFSETVENNIHFGTQNQKTSMPLNEVIHRAALTEEINRFPQGTQTLVGEKGIMLSGGQKQRISLARSMVEPCQLLILDNVLSAVDYETERFLLAQILKRENANSLLIVSHRVRALENADLIIVLDQGKLVQSGTHTQLMAQTGTYAETYRLQNQGNHETN